MKEIMHTFLNDCMSSPIHLQSSFFFMVNAIRKDVHECTPYTAARLKMQSGTYHLSKQEENTMGTILHCMHVIPFSPLLCKQPVYTRTTRLYTLVLQTM